MFLASIFYSSNFPQLFFHKINIFPIIAKKHRRTNPSLILKTKKSLHHKSTLIFVSEQMNLHPQLADANAVWIDQFEQLMSQSLFFRE
ncbi:hypothetical protein DW612_00100 [Enterococcus faecium]|nr:hypothetical protein [Enterococcus faecium]